MLWGCRHPNIVGSERLSEYEGRVNTTYPTPDIDVCILTDAPVKMGVLRGSGDCERGRQSEPNRSNSPKSPFGYFRAMPKVTPRSDKLTLSRSGWAHGRVAFPPTRTGVRAFRPSPRPRSGPSSPMRLPSRSAAQLQQLLLQLALDAARGVTDSISLASVRGRSSIIPLFRLSQPNPLCWALVGSPLELGHEVRRNSISRAAPAISASARPRCGPAPARPPCASGRRPSGWP